jgi:hypothetical protein
MVPHETAAVGLGLQSLGGNLNEWATHLDRHRSTVAFDIVAASVRPRRSRQPDRS